MDVYDRLGNKNRNTTRAISRDGRLRTSGLEQLETQPVDVANVDVVKLHIRRAVLRDRILLY